MHFEYSWFLYVLIFIPFLIVFFIFAWKNRISSLRKFASESAVARLSSNLNNRKRVLKIILVITAVLFLIISISGPLVGGKLVEIRRSGVDIIIAVDCSVSMLAKDMKPDRMTKAKDSLSLLINKMKNDRIGIVAFAGVAFLQCPLTLDYSAAKMLLNNIDTNLIPKPGTSLGEAIRLAMKSFSQNERKYKTLILLTDGEDHKSDPLGATTLAKKEGIKIYTVGIGKLEGELIPIYNEMGKVSGYKKNKKGEVVSSKLDELLLQKIALETGGKYYRATESEMELDRIYEDISNMEKKELKSTTYIKYENRYQIFVLFSVLLLLTEMIISERKGIWLPWKK
ncbi:MAG: VWA domain-containing protein [Candidatus Firestonebacteria bacterium]